MSYAILKKKKDGLHISLTNAGREWLDGERDGMGWKRGTLYILRDLIEDWLCNGWTWINPEDIGALTSAPILSDTARHDDNGELKSVKTVYWFPNYAVTCEIEELLDKGEVVFEKAA